MKTKAMAESAYRALLRDYFARVESGENTDKFFRGKEPILRWARNACGRPIR